MHFIGLVSGQRKTQLLVVDDDRAVRKLLERIALRAGLTVDTARDGQEAMEKLVETEFDIVIVDLMMPRVSGYDLVQQISTLDPRPCVIVATAMLNGDVAKLDDSMVRRVIKKPFDIEAVANTLIETARSVAASRAEDAVAAPATTDVKVSIASDAAPAEPQVARPEVNPAEEASPVVPPSGKPTRSA